MLKWFISLVIVADLGLVAWGVWGGKIDFALEKSGATTVEVNQNSDNVAVVGDFELGPEFYRLNELEGVEVRRFDFTVASKTGEIVVVKMKKGSYRARLMEDVAKPKYIKAWADECDSCLVINGAYFMEDNKAAGFLMVDGERENPEGFYDQNRSGLILMEEGNLKMRDLAADPVVVGLTGLENALQSYPFLIKNKQGAIKEDSGKTARRTAIGVDEEGNLYVIFVDQSDLSLYRLMKELLKTGIEFEYVLNLDGGPSSGMTSSFDGEKAGFHSYTPVPNVLIFDFSDR